MFITRLIHFMCLIVWIYKTAFDIISLSKHSSTIQLCCTNSVQRKQKFIKSIDWNDIAAFAYDQTTQFFKWLMMLDRNVILLHVYLIDCVISMVITQKNCAFVCASSITTLFLAECLMRTNRAGSSLDVLI